MKNIYLSLLLFLSVSITAYAQTEAIKEQQISDTTSILTSVDSATFYSTELANELAIDDLLVIEDVNPDQPLGNRKPLLLIHGWNFDGKPAPPGSSYWNNFKNYVLNDRELIKSFKPYLVKYWSNAVTINEISAELRKKVEEAGLNEKKIVIVGHSMGGLVSRSYINEQFFTKGIAAGNKCGEQVDLLITLGSPHHGTPMANGPARDAKVNFLLKITMATLDGFVFSETKYNDVNRSDLRWDNYDGLLDYSKYSNEKNQWLVNLNANTQYDAKTICYTAAIEGELIIPENGNAQQQFKLGSFLMKQSFGFANDGIVPVKSSGFEGHTVKRVRNFLNYHHSEIIQGKTDQAELFTPLKSDLMEVAPVQLVWPSAQTVYLKHSGYQKILWNAPVSIPKINLYFSSNGGVTFTSIASNIDASLGEFNWYIPDLNSGNCLVKITNTSRESESDISIKPFTIFHNQITKIAPIVDPYFVAGRSNTIQWTQEGLGKRVKITYNDQPNGIQRIIADGITTTPGTNSFSWTPDLSIVPTANALVKIQLQNLMEDYGDDETYTFSSQEISVLGDQQIILKSPETFPLDFTGIAGEQLEIGKNYRINWETKGEIKYAELYLCDKQKKELKLIGEKNLIPSYIAKAYFDWTVDEFYGDEFYFLMKGGINPSTLTVETDFGNSFRINRMPKIVSPSAETENTPLLPVLEMDRIENANQYEWAFETNDTTQSKKIVSGKNKTILSKSIDNELLPGLTYMLEVVASSADFSSYHKQISFTTEKVKPYSFSKIAPATNKEVEGKTLELKWHHAVGAASYELTVIQNNEIILTNTNLSRTDTSLIINLNEYKYFEPIVWEVKAKNDFGETKIESTFIRKYNTAINDRLSKNYSLVNYPNPFNNETFFEFSVPEYEDGDLVDLSIYDLTGNKVATLVNNTLAAGNYKYKWDGTRSTGVIMNNGVYICRFSTDKTVQNKLIVKE